jgi:hypothetical protein
MSPARLSAAAIRAHKHPAPEGGTMSATTESQPVGDAPRTGAGGVVAVTDFARCVAGWARLVARRELSSPKRFVGTRLRFADGTSSLVFRETARAGAPTPEPVLLVIQFRLAFLGSNRLLHAAFRRECVLHTPLFAGFPGFRSKLWADDVDTGVYRGIYEWQGAGAANHYAQRMVGLLAPFSTPGTARYRVVERVRRDDVLRDPGLAPGGDADAWCRLTEAVTH